MTAETGDADKMHAVAQLWETDIDGKELFKAVEKEVSGHDMKAQLKRKIGS